MNAVAKRYPIALNVLVIAVTIVFVSVVLLVGRATAEPRIELFIGSSAPETFVATRAVTVDDNAATLQAQNAARLNTPEVFLNDPTVSRDVQTNLRSILGAVALNAFDDSDPEEPGGQAPVGTTTSAAPGEESTTTALTLGSSSGSSVISENDRI